MLEDASRGEFQAVDRRRISVILGVASATELVVQLGSRIQRPIWTNAMRAAGLSETQITDVCDRIASHYVPWQEASFPGLLGNVVAGRIANRLDLGGTNVVTDTACASSFAAIELGLNELYLGQSDLVISGGVDAINDIFMYMCFSKTPALSPTGDCRPFSEKADGTLLGEGLGMFALRRLEDAERDGNHIYAVIRGLGSSSDGRATSIYGPKSEGQALALSRAYEAAGYSPATVGMVEAHGTGTKAGDLAEVTALKSVFRAADEDRAPWCALGSIKSQIGHTKAAAGAAGLFKTVMALRHKVLPPTIKVERPAMAVAGDDSPFYVNTRARPWIASPMHPRRASVSSFGFGGSNFHLTLEEYTGAKVAERLPAHSAALFLLSAASRGSLTEACTNLAGAVEAGAFFARARDSQLAFDSTAAARAALVAANVDDLRHKLTRLADQLRSSGDLVAQPGVYAGFGPSQAGKLAFVFPGQGSQYVGMGAEIAMEFDLARQVWDQLSGDGQRLEDAVFPPSAFGADAERRQNDTLATQAQPAIAATSLSQLALLHAAGVGPDLVAGHSFGEVMALHCAGAFDADTALRIAHKRGAVMREAAGTTEGAMTAVVASREQVTDLLRTTGLDIVIANDNAPDQVVLSGPTANIAECEQRLAAAGIRSTRLPVASAFHSSIVSAASTPLATYLAGQKVEAPRLPVIGTAAAVPYPTEPDSVRATLAAQLATPVRFRDQVEALYAAGARTFVEVGPGSVLTGLLERCLRGRPATFIAMDRKGRNGVASFWEALAQLAATGVRLTFAPLWDGVRVDEPAAPTGPGTVQILGSNYGKPYPAKTGIAPPAPPAPPAPVRIAQEAAVVPAMPSDQRMATFAAFQNQIAESQRAFQTALADSHRAFLETTERALQSLSGNPGTVTSAIPAAPVQRMAPEPAFVAPAAPTVAPFSVKAAPAAAKASPPASTNKIVVAIDPAAVLLEVVAAKTGYPAEMLNLTMSLEADLGVDSIKQVEILAALRERAPGLPEVDAADLARLRTPGAIVEFLGAQTTKVATNAPAEPAAAPAAMAPSPDLEAALLAVVAEKTGYPAEMLNLTMSIEGDLGIDSIKQVEILSALRERAPTMRELGPSELSRLRTLGAILEYLTGALPATASSRDPALLVGRAIVTQVDAPRSTTERPLPARAIALVADQGGVADALAPLLRARGCTVHVGKDIPAASDGVVLLAGLDDDEVVSRHRAALMAAKEVAPRFTKDGGLFVVVQRSGAASGLVGLVKCAAQEWPAITRSIEIEVAGRSAQALAKELCSELLCESDAAEVLLGADGRRSTVQHAVGTQPTTGPTRLDAESVVVISGGARGVTAAAAIALARAHRCRFVLLGRTPLVEEDSRTAGMDGMAELQRALASAAGGAAPPAALREQAESILAGREVRQTLAAIEQAGGVGRYVAVDVRDGAAVATAIAGIRREWGPITALIHGAGVIADKRIADKTVAQFDLVFGTKVIGFQSLLGATYDDPLRVLCVFSSVAARSGNAGQSDYAMANATITAMARQEGARRGPACLVKAIHWGPWAGGMVTPSLATRFERAGVPLIHLGAGADFLVRELADTADGAIEVVAGGPLPSAHRTPSAAANASA